MKDFLFYGDTHLKDYGSFPAYNKVEGNRLTKEINNTLKGFCFVADRIKELKPKTVINTGDTYNSPDGVPTRCLTASDIGLGKIRDACLSVGAEHYILDGGNHEILNESNETNMSVTSTRVLCGYGKIISDFQIIDVDGFKIAFLPYSTNQEYIYKKMGECEGKADILVTHLDFAELKYDTGIQSKSSLLAQCSVPIYTGHIHIYQAVGNLVCVGSLVRNKFYTSDTKSIGGIVILDGETKQHRFIPNTYSKHYLKLKNTDDIKNIDKDQFIIQLESNLYVQHLHHRNQLHHRAKHIYTHF